LGGYLWLFLLLQLWFIFTLDFLLYFFFLIEASDISMVWCFGSAAVPVTGVGVATAPVTGIGVTTVPVVVLK